jgi:hypothetical protein
VIDKAIKDSAMKKGIKTKAHFTEGDEILADKT